LLDPIDHFVKRELRCAGYVRYVDDLLLFSHDKGALWAAKREVQARLESLRLTIHPGAHPKPVGEGIPFLGFVVWPEARRLKRRNGVRFRRRLKVLTSAFEAGQLTEGRLSSSLQGWLNHARYANAVGLQKALCSTVSFCRVSAR
ncbi:MAG TPA: RNA-directed DNA polymerase, partial [Thermoanaerobaculia bacterium]|nr:RNA-directed DNA polymerase [Thermoanaerobaculia bacterium]